jgi:hypothetical protein
MWKVAGWGFAVVVSLLFGGHVGFVAAGWSILGDPLLRWQLAYLVRVASPCEPGEVEPAVEHLCVGVLIADHGPGPILEGEVRGVWMPPDYLAETVVRDPRGKTLAQRGVAGELVDERRLAGPP